MRMDEDKKPIKYLNWQPVVKRPVGRPRKRWIEGLKTAICIRGSSLEQVEELHSYENR